MTNYDLESLSDVEGFCKCGDNDCNCGEKNVHEWAWDDSLATSKAILTRKNLEVVFHPQVSCGTAAVRGNKFLERDRHHYWEIKILSSICGTDVMVGVGTSKAGLQCPYTYRSLVGQDRQSWGLSYRGYIQHDGQKKDYSKRFGQKSLVGVHLDTWKGTLQFFLDGKPLGVAFTGLRNLELYPMVSSTVARSSVRIAHSYSVPASLQMDCLSILRPNQRSYLSAAFPGLRYLSKSIFADVLRKRSDGMDEDIDYEFPEEFLILDDMDYALVGFGPRRIRRKVENPAPMETDDSLERPLLNFCVVPVPIQRTV